MEKFSRTGLLVTAILVLHSCGTSDKPKEKDKENVNSLAFAKLKGNVREITETTWVIMDDEDGKPVTYLDVKIFTRYNKDGKRIEEIVYSPEESAPEDSFGLRNVFTYDERGNWTGDSVFETNASLLETWVHIYDNNNNEIERKRVNPDGSSSYRDVFRYDEKGRKIEEINYSETDTIWGAQTFKYDEKGNKIEEVSLDPKGVITSRRTFKYDEKGNNIERKSFTQDGTLEYRFTNQYDEKGRKVDEISYQKDGTTIDRKETYKYDDRDNEIELVDDSPGRYTYYQTSEYKYDEKGNWIKKTMYADKSKTSDEWTERKIVYY